MNTTEGINYEVQQRANRALVINLLKKEGTCSRACLADLSGLRRATITNIINEFIACDLVVETGKLSGESGNRCIGIRINGKTFRVIGAMITRKSYSILSMGLSGKVYDVISYPIQKGERVQEIIKRIIEAIRKLIKDSEECEILAICIAIPGPYKQKSDEVIFVSNYNQWDGVRISKELQEAFPVPVIIENDANAGAYSMLWNINKRFECENLVYILAGQGIGCGVIINNNIVIGKDGFAGEIGHISIKLDGNPCECGNVGCLETYCSTIVFEKRLLECIKNNEKTILREDFTWNDVIDAMNQGDEIVCREYKAICTYLAAGVAMVIGQLNPEMVVIGDQLTQVQPELMYEIIMEYIQKRIRPAILADFKLVIDKSEINPVLTGAAAIATQKVLENPLKFVKNKKRKES